MIVVLREVKRNCGGRMVMEIQHYIHIKYPTRLQADMKPAQIHLTSDFALSN